MRHHLLILFHLSTIAAGQIPACATGCIVDAVKSATTCDIQDLACQCTSSNYALIEAAATTCVLTDCGSDAINVLSAVNAQCQAALSLSFSSSAIAAATSASASPSAAGTAGSGLETATETAEPTTVTGTIVECGCGDLATATMVPSAVPSPTASKNGTVTAGEPPVTYTESSGALRTWAGAGSGLVVGFLVLVVV